MTPRSVMRPSISSAGVTSKAGLAARTRRRQLDLCDPAVGEPAPDMGDFAGVALLDLDFAPVVDAPVDRRAGRGDIERHAVYVGGERLQISADLVGRVTARGD